MLAYKAWRESKARFLVMAWTIVALCVGFVLLYKNGGLIRRYLKKLR